MREEERLLAGLLFSPADPELRSMKRKAHNLSTRYNQTFEDDVEERAEILQQLLGEMGEGCFCQGPIYFHYGVHTKMGKGVFANFNFTVQDDCTVTIGDYCRFGPNVTIVTPIHPMVGKERYVLETPKGPRYGLCYAKPVHIGNDCWFGARVTVCPGVTIGDGCVIGAGSVVTRDIPANTFAAGVPCRVIREITEADSMLHRPELFYGMD